jgi:SAM-dependent methyltransferase
VRITRCRVSGSDDLRPFLDLGVTPLSDALLRSEDLSRPESRFPLEVAFCPQSALVQILDDVPPQTLFVDNYLYFSSFSQRLLDHSREHALRLAHERGLGRDSLVVEVASNDGYLLRNFVERGVPVLGVDPAPAQAAAARAQGVATVEAFFTRALAERLAAEGRRADAIIANNVMAHVPDPNDVVAGMKRLLAPDGVITVENPYVRDLVAHCEFDTIYHEHFFYHSCSSIRYLFERHGLYLNDVEYFPDLHGGTLRWSLGHRPEPTPAVAEYLAAEAESGLTGFAYYQDFSRRVLDVRERLLGLLRGLRGEGKRIAAYGAAAKGSTLLNFCGIGTDLVEFVVDRNVHKHGLLMPGTHQPIRGTEALLAERPDYTLLLAWNFKDEIVRQQADYLAAGGRFIVPIPTPEVIGG